ncbi:SprT family zinc-dependent metalloprotease [Atopomonas sediminilitoris]|uniref:SprT family zinc-dependent metalloprotease n=1 Tax=Atopomonas sediminilitoris TaxID=2919919 RepID=UPI001F4E3B06|nr:SprT family zinc-dependent metalloprotease [Atopomonas sediminilitoris]MCJ8168923.1 SprT family zinc-dependent metalloprotease [Atopomonas sediminilitoris]
MPEALKQHVEACYQRAEQHFQRRFARPEISIKLRGQKAGVAHLTENKLRFNWVLYQANQHDFLAQTVAHEVAHMIAHQLYGLRIQPHGPEWQSIMREVFKRPATRCHHYAITRTPRTHYLYQCGCAEPMPFTGQRHQRVRRGAGYLCRRCKQKLIFSGETRQQ